MKTGDWKVRIDTNAESDLYVVRNTFAAGGHTGWHTHPGPSLITVTVGTITAYEGDDPTCTPHVYPQGSTLIDPGGGHVHLLRNEDGQPGGDGCSAAGSSRCAPEGSTLRQTRVIAHSENDKKGEATRRRLAGAAGGLTSRGVAMAWPAVPQPPTHAQEAKRACLFSKKIKLPDDWRAHAWI